MTLTSPLAVTLVQAATMLAEHLDDHAPPEPASLNVATRSEHCAVTAQLHSNTVPEIAGDLLAWADTLNVVAVEAWRPPERNRVHLSLRGTLTGSTGTVELKVFSGVDYDPARFADLQPDTCQAVSLRQLHTWAANPSTTTDASVLKSPRGIR